jgi:predicted metalloendopeptidase
MKKLALGAACACLAAACSKPPPAPAATAPAAPAAPVLTSGIDTSFFDDSIRAQDDFYKHVNGKWLATAEIPADKGTFGSFTKIADDTQEQLRGLIEDAAKSGDTTNPDQQKIGDLYNSFMDEASLETLGLKPLDAELQRVDALKNKSEIATLIAHFNQIGVEAPYGPQVHQDARDSTKYVFDLGQSGLGLPDRDYYLQDDPKLKQIRQAYAAHVERMLGLAGAKDAARQATQIVALETALAKVQWTKVENRDPVKTYNKVELAALPKLAPGYDWKDYLTQAGVDGKVDYLVISQPSYITGFNALLEKTPLPVWKAYFRWHVISDYAPYLSKAFVDQNFAFYGTALRGIPENRPRWKRGVGTVEEAVGESLGRLYVAKYFPPESKQRMDALVKNLLAAYRADIDTLDWMSPDTRKKAQEKLAKLTTKIGYPSKWRDYSTLTIAKGDLVGDVMRGQTFEYKRNVDKLGKPIDREEWDMTPQTVNAYYDPEQNEIVFPAAILQPPFFDAKADDAVNYGGIGGVIGHEISHGFDDQGSQYDGDGNLLDAPGWFTKDDLAKYKARTHALVEQYAAFELIPGFHVNGELTLGENIADNSGIAIAHKAYGISLNGTPAPVIDGMTGEQRFYIGWAQIWRAKVRENEAVLRIKSDPHSPPSIRGTVPPMNQASFDDAFGIKEGDKMYLAPDKRVTIW